MFPDKLTYRNIWCEISRNLSIISTENLIFKIIKRFKMFSILILNYSTSFYSNEIWPFLLQIATVFYGRTLTSISNFFLIFRLYLPFTWAHSKTRTWSWSSKNCYMSIYKCSGKNYIRITNYDARIHFDRPRNLHTQNRTQVNSWSHLLFGLEFRSKRISIPSVFRIHICRKKPFP